MKKIYEIDNVNLWVESTLPILSIKDMEICQEGNRHMLLFLQAIVDSREMGLHNDWFDNKIILKTGKQDNTLFCGEVERLYTKKENQFLEIEIAAVGNTIMLDKEKKKRSFQDINMTYQQILSKVLRDYEGINIVWNIGLDRAIGEPLIQYKETDWEFLTRICSHFHGKLFSHFSGGRSEVSFGMMKGRLRLLEDVDILEIGFDINYYKNECYEDNLPQREAFYLYVKSKENWEVGDYVMYERQKYQIYKKEVAFKKGELLFKYYFGKRGMHYQKKKYNELLAGVRLEGTVKKAVNESVYIQLNIDVEEESVYPWKWAPETNNFCYCMPEVETKVSLYFAEKEEKSGCAILGAIDNLLNASGAKPQNREFTTKWKKKIGLHPNRLFMEGRSGKAMLLLQDMFGIQLIGKTGVSFVANEDISIVGKKIWIMAPEEIVCKTPQSNIELCRDINLYAQEGVRTVGTGDISASNNIFDHDKKNDLTVEHWEASYSAMASVPTVDLVKVKDIEAAIDLFALGSLAKIANGSATIAMSEIMDGKKESESSFPSIFRSMENYTVKGGYSLQDEERYKEG